MPLKAFNIALRTDLNGTAQVQPVCDLCGEVIGPEDPGNIEHEEVDGSPVFFVHKRCSKDFNRIWGKKTLWSELIQVKLITR